MVGSVKTENRVQQLARRLELSPEAMALYFSVPVSTMKKWLEGERSPPAAVTRLVEVLGMVEVTCPDLHDFLLTGGVK